MVHFCPLLRFLFHATVCSMGRQKTGRPRGRPRKGTFTPAKKRELDFRHTKTLADAVAQCVRSYPPGALDIQATIEDIQIRWEDLEKITLVFVAKGLELLPTITKATDALTCADRLMSIAEKRAVMAAAVNQGLSEAGISIRFSTAEELGLDTPERNLQ
jgi:hypothetical protein